METPDILTEQRAQHFCDEEGILPAIAAAIERGQLIDYDTPEDYLEAVLEGAEIDEIEDFGWKPCPNSALCKRNGRCRRAGG